MSVKENKKSYKVCDGNDSNKMNCVFNCFEWVPTRMVLYLLCLGGITITFVMRTAINLTILAMVKEKPVVESLNRSETLCYVTDNSTTTTIDYGGNLDWSINVQYYILTSFYWMYIVAQVFGGIAAQKFGTKKVFGWSLFITSCCNLCIPICSNIHYAIVIFLQLIHGFAQGFTWSAVYAVIGHWIPIQERGRFVTCFQGLSLGATFANLMAGIVIAKLGWIYVFYTIGSIGLLCTILWYLLMHDKPEHHPRISHQELRYIQKNREQCLHSEKQIPWISILTSVPVWAIGITSFGRMWISSIMLVYGPLYLKTVIGLKVEMNGVLLAVSTFSAFLSALLFSFISDKLVTHKVVSILFNRKLFSAIGQIIPGILSITIGYLNCNIPLIITNWVLIKIFITSGFLGPMTNIVDISPSYTGPVSSVVQVLLLLPTVLATMMVKILLQEENILQAWRTIFCISSGIVIGTFVFYAIFASAKVQLWDFTNKPDDLNEEAAERELLNGKALKLRKIEILPTQTTSDEVFTEII